MILSRLFTVLGVNPFSRLVQHIAVGNQLVVQSLTEDIHSTLTLSALAKLLPKGCIRQVCPVYTLFLFCMRFYSISHKDIM